MTSHTLRVLDIVSGTSVDGPGLRTSIYFAGCNHRCPGCHNPQSWDFDGGSEMSVKQIMAVIEENGFNVTFSGGDPLMQPADALIALASEIKKAGYTLWCYTGFLYDDLLTIDRYNTILALTDVLVDGPFVENLRDTSLDFRGSSNQRLINLRQSERQKRIVLWEH